MPNALRITFVLPVYDLGGGTRVLATYAERLRRRGHDITVVAPPPKVPPLRRRVKSWLTGRRPAGHTGPTASFFDGFGPGRRLLNRHRPVVDADVPDGDVVIATWWETAEWVAALDPSKGVKVHFIQGQEANPLWFAPASIPRARAVYRLPLARVTISHSLVDWLTSEFDCRDVALVPNSVDLDLFHAPERGRQRAPTVGLLYSDSPAKGLEISLQALARVRERIPDVQVVAFGLVPEIPALPLPAGTRFHLAPAQDRIRELYAQCDVWLCGSRVEGFALPPLEAMACRCPVVSTRVGGPDQTVIDGVNGYLVAVGDVAGLADRVVDVLTLPEGSWRAMSDAAYATATGFTWEDATDLLEATLRRIVDRPAADADRST